LGVRPKTQPMTVGLVKKRHETIHYKLAFSQTTDVEILYVE